MSTRAWVAIFEFCVVKVEKKIKREKKVRKKMQKINICGVYLNASQLKPGNTAYIIEITLLLAWVHCPTLWFPRTEIGTSLNFYEISFALLSIFCPLVTMGFLLNLWFPQLFYLLFCIKKCHATYQDFVYCLIV